MLPVSGGSEANQAKPTPTEGNGRWPFYERDERDAADRVLESGAVNYWTGSEGREFEREYAAYLGRRHSVALANGTLALELALRVLGIGPGDEVVTTPRTFIASASCAVSLGARPVFADVDPDSQNITAESIRAVLTPATKAIIVVHLAGWPCEMDAITALAKEHGLKVIEDCAQAHGATYKGRPVGSIGDIGAFSFCQDKIITTAGEGGLIALNSDEQFEAAWAYKDHGKSYDAVYRREHQPGFRWLHESFGSNWRLTEIQSAIGRIQLGKLDGWVEARRRNAEALISHLSAFSCMRVPVPAAHIRHSYYRLYAFVRPEKLRSGWSRDRIQTELTALGVRCNVGSCGEVYLEKAFPENWRPEPRLPVAAELSETSITFLVHPTLSRNEIASTREAIDAVLQSASQ